MKQFHELTEQQQRKAEAHFTNKLLEWIILGQLRLNDEANGDDVQERIDKAIAKAEQMQTPWFAHEYIMDDEKCAETIRSMASCDAQDAVYMEEETAVSLRTIEKIELS